ncbi:MAG: hypothetical protein ACTSPG_09000 [Candidatus Hodarchaeales archaeon]
MIAFLGYRLMKSPENWIWTCILASTTVWYLIDTSISLIAGSLLNV